MALVFVFLTLLVITTAGNDQWTDEKVPFKNHVLGSTRFTIGIIDKICPKIKSRIRTFIFSEISYS